MTAVQAVLTHAQRRPTSGSDIALLRSTQLPHTLWEGNLLIHLAVLCALAPLPQHALVADGIRTALRHQRPDGGCRSSPTRAPGSPPTPPSRFWRALAPGQQAVE
ncbi:hypothetical protein [Kitasatospora sp. NPDC050463]|uniref:hypothetical protein n=1 Tax=Kitasatospora sp. NPDC050463 TaxID=3155786 RepID=UPI0033CD775E